MIEENIKLLAVTPPKYMNTKCNTIDAISIARDCFKVRIN